ncbi:MAG TPA: HEPN domain-containing protein [Thermoanaerobaculia bacterium]|nr:HEPN domain-containing protein [Thermoanaerobaculia bacterium]
MATDELTERIKAGFARANEKLAVAKHVLAAGYPADAVSPAYYAVFHAAEAVLLVEGDEPRSHEGLKTLFGLRFVKTGRLPAEMASILRELKDERESSDYSIFPAITAEEGERAVASAARFIVTLEAFLHAQGFATSD